MQLIRDFAKAPFEQLRIFDFGCGEGVYALEAALRGADVVGFDGRTERMEAGAQACATAGFDKLEVPESRRPGYYRGLARECGTSSFFSDFSII